MKNVECLLSGIKVVERKRAVVTEVSGVESDSRQVKKDNLFVAVRGASVDGHDFIGQAIAQGAVSLFAKDFHTMPLPTNRMRPHCLPLSHTTLAAPTFRETLRKQRQQPPVQ